jgi:hypothetical protein
MKMRIRQQDIAKALRNILKVTEAAAKCVNGTTAASETAQMQRYQRSQMKDGGITLLNCVY